MKFLHEIQGKYRPSKRVANIMYVGGILEAMIQTEALRLAMQQKPLENLKPADVLNNGFYRIKNLETGGLSSNTVDVRPG